MAVRFLRPRRRTAAQRHRHRDSATRSTSVRILCRACGRFRGECDPLRYRSRRPSARGCDAKTRSAPQRCEMARLEMRLAEAAAALATLDEVVGKEPRSLMERDSGILRLIYTF